MCGAGLEVAPASLDFELWVFEGDEGVPASSPLVHHSVSVSVTDTTLDAPLVSFSGPTGPVNAYGTDIYEFETSIAPLSLSAGSVYWLSIALNDTSVDRLAYGQWHWCRAVSEFADYFAYQPGSLPDVCYVTLLAEQINGVETEDPAFSVKETTGTTVPLPSSALLGLGMLGLLGVVRRTRGTSA